MTINKVELEQLMKKAVEGIITKRGSKKLLKALWKKRQNGRLTRLRERVVLSAYVLYDYDKIRSRYIKWMIAKLRRESTTEWCP